ncbi:MAG TPA: fibronectin type III domain-containing protein, partial [Acidobacteriota bacterium]|nr:fibronectin type III domain-containing protein [Acidobacteriota bacterium]
MIQSYVMHMDKFGSRYQRLIAIFMIVLIVSMSPIFAFQISNVRVAPNTKSAVFTFNTDENATGFVSINGQTYQETPSSFVKTHTVTVSGLNPDTTYNYKVVANNQQLQSTETAQSTFKTKATDGQLTFEATIASVVTNPFTINGKTTPDAFVTVYINGVPKKSTASDSTGNITFTNLFIDEGKENEILVEVTQTGNTNKFTRTYKVTADNTVPLLTVEPPAEYASKSSIDLKGSVDESVTLSGNILYASGTKTDLRSTRVSAGNFTYGVTLDDGINQITLIATDAAGNNAEYTTTVIVDKEDIKIIDTNLDELSPAFTTQLNVKGQVNKPGATVRVYVDPNDRSIGPCREVTTITVNGETSDDMCSGFGPWKAIESDGDYEEVTADDQGYFTVKISLDPRLAIFEKVGVTNTDKILTTSATTNNANDKGFDVDAELGTAERYKVTVVAVDQYKRADSETRDITYSPCGTSGDWSVRVGEVYPTILQPDHIMQGYAQISFKLDLKYFGQGQDTVS